jgi:hypothetical protein
MCITLSDTGCATQCSRTSASLLQQHSSRRRATVTIVAAAGDSSDSNDSASNSAKPLMTPPDVTQFQSDSQRRRNRPLSQLKRKKKASTVKTLLYAYIIGKYMFMVICSEQRCSINPYTGSHLLSQTCNSYLFHQIVNDDLINLMARSCFVSQLCWCGREHRCRLPAVTLQIQHQ